MRILVLTDAYPPQSLGGYEASCSMFAADLARRGHQVRVVTAGPAPDRDLPRGVHWVLHRPQDTASLVRQLPWEAADRDLGIQDAVRFLKNVPRESLQDLSRRHHVLVFPGSHREGFSVALLEAMASGLAVVGTASGGSAEILEDGANALVIPPEDPGALAECLLRLAREPGLVQRLAEAGQARVRERYDMVHVGGLLEEYLRQRSGPECAASPAS
jgi:glycosyltransferase involved in cell wall biosynthesis